MEKVIDAKGKKIGRVATEAALVLMGKDAPDFSKHTVASRKVHITNVALSDVQNKKIENKVYTRYSGYPGGLKHQKLGKLIEKKGLSEAFRKAVYGMLPDNRLRPILMKNLTVSE